MGEFANFAADTERIGAAELIRLHAWVEPDGATAVVTILSTEGATDLHFTMEQIAAACVELRNAGLLMFRRQLLDRDNARAAFEELMRVARRPASITASVDEETGDRVIVCRFADQMPFVVRLTPDQIVGAMAGITSDIKRLSN